MNEIIAVMTKPEVLITMGAAVAVFLTVITLMLPSLSRDKLPMRMRVMAVERDKMRSQRLTDLGKKDGVTLRQTHAGFMNEIVDKLNLRATFDTDEVRNKLKMAGLRGQAPLVAFMFFRMAMPIIVAIATLIYMFVLADYDYPPIVKVGVAIVAGYIGFYLPNVFIQNIVQKRQDSIKEAFPDAVDLLLICVQSGMSVEAAFAKVSTEVGVQSLELAEEFSLTTAELSYLQDRRMAFDNFGKRTGLAGVKSMATALNQAEKYGTPVGQALRVMAKENRDSRMADAEAKAAALPPKLTVPMIVFNLPVLFAIILGPAIIQVTSIPT
jgi:tight adherence protein C